MHRQPTALRIKGISKAKTPFDSGILRKAIHYSARAKGSRGASLRYGFWQSLLLYAPIPTRLYLIALLKIHIFLTTLFSVLLKDQTKTTTNLWKSKGQNYEKQ